MAKKKTHFLSGTFNRSAPPPPAPRDNTVDIFHGQEVADPYRPLEDLDAPATDQWVDAQNARFEKLIADVQTHDETAAALLRLRDYAEEGVAGRRGMRLFRWAQPAGAAQYRYEVQDTPVSAWRVLLDPDTMAAEGENAAIQSVAVSPDGRLCAYTLAENGSDSITLRVRDVETGEDLPDSLPDLRFTSAAWDEDNKGFVYGRPANDGTGRFVLMHHALGAAVDADAEIYRSPQDQTIPAFTRSEGHEFVTVRVGTLPHAEILMRDKTDGTFKTIVAGGEASYRICGVRDNKLYLLTERAAPRGALIALDLDQPAVENAQIVIPEFEDGAILNSVILHGGYTIASLRKGANEILRVYDADGEFLHDAPIAAGDSFSFGPRHKDDHALILLIDSPRERGAVFAYDPQRNSLTRQRDSLAPANLKDCIVETLHAVSKDGTRVPFTLIRDPQTKLDGSAALRLYGYGGFNASESLSYNSDIAHWVRSGGIYAVAQLRGGGEFGRDWYDGGRLHNKQNVFDDFAACARTLIRRKYTSSNRLVIEGGSNGGLLTLATMLQQPQLFGAVISSVPVTDMLRFHKFTYGAFWKSDYGDPEANADDFRTSMGYSPLHNVRAGRLYPPCLVLTGDHDDRVVPSHAYKFMAALQEKAHPDTMAFLRVARNTGHGAGKSLADGVAEDAAIYAFIEKAIGPLRQDEYKAVLARRSASGPALCVG